MLYIPLEIAKNIGMAIPGLRQLSQLRHKTGVAAEADRLGYITSRYFGDLPVRHKHVLELGPGRAFRVLQTALNMGASRAVGCDIEQYMSPSLCKTLGIEYSIYNGRILPFPSESFDFVCSHSVLEHVRYPREVISELVRVLRPHGRFIHFVDLRDHMTMGHRDSSVFRCLRWPNWLWNAMAWHRSTYVNRLRISQWLSIISDAGIQALATERFENRVVRERRSAGGLRYLQHLNDEDACTEAFWCYGTKPAGS